jgi:hypothetical protein
MLALSLNYHDNQINIVHVISTFNSNSDSLSLHVDDRIPKTACHIHFRLTYKFACCAAHTMRLSAPVLSVSLLPFLSGALPTPTHSLALSTRVAITSVPSATDAPSRHDNNFVPSIPPHSLNLPTVSPLSLNLPTVSVPKLSISSFSLNLPA